MDTNVPWPQQAFGDQANAVRLGVAQALRNMHENALGAQEEAHVAAKDPYGASRYVGQFERMGEELGGLPGFRPVKPRGFRHTLPMVGRGLLYPFRYAKTKSDVRCAQVPDSRLVRELLSNFGTEPESHQVSLFEDGQFAEVPLELRAGLADLQPDTRVVLVAFACSAGGLLEAFWGVASLASDGSTVDWASAPEPLPVPDQPSARPRLSSVPEQSGHAIDLPRFDQGDEPTIDLLTRPGHDVRREIPPQSEAEPNEPLTNENDDD